MLGHLYDSLNQKTEQFTGTKALNTSHVKTTRESRAAAAAMDSAHHTLNHNNLIVESQEENIEATSQVAVPPSPSLLHQFTREEEKKARVEGIEEAALQNHTQK